MSERYWLTGVQLALLAEADYGFRQKIFNKVYDEQFIGNEKDLKKVLKGLKK